MMSYCCLKHRSWVHVRTVSVLDAYIVACLASPLWFAFSLCLVELWRNAGGSTGKPKRSNKISGSFCVRLKRIYTICRLALRRLAT